MGVGQVTEINPEWAGLVGKDSDRQGPSGGPYSVRTESGVYLMRDVGKLAAQQQGALARVQLSVQPGAASTWDTDGWAMTGPESAFEIRGVSLFASTTPVNMLSVSCCLVDTLAADTPVALLAWGELTAAARLTASYAQLTTPTGVQGSLARLPIFLRQQNTRWAIRLDALSGAGGAVSVPLLCNVWYAQSLPGVDLDRG